MDFDTSLEYARKLDRRDDLGRFRERFLIDDPGLIYLDGNSLGRVPKDAISLMDRVIRHQWGNRLIRAWNDEWMGLSRRIGGKLAGLIGARPDEVIIADSTSVNLFKLIAGALKERPGRRRIVTDSVNFPSDIYILKAVADMLDPAYELVVLPVDNGFAVSEEALDRAIDDDTALVLLSHVMYKSSYMYDMARITEIAHGRDAMILWDLSHSAGVVPMACHDLGIELAVGSTYKYLNGGPGAPAFLYVRDDLQDRLANPISGWFGHRKQFYFDTEFEPASGIDRYLTGTPSVLSLAMIEPGVDLAVEAGVDPIRAKSLSQSEYLVALWASELAPLGFTLNSPRNGARRGSHVSFGHAEGYRIDQAIREERQVISDFRMPDNIRLGIAPLYTTYEELHTAVHALREVVQSGSFRQYSAVIKGVT